MFFSGLSFSEPIFGPTDSYRAMRDAMAREGCFVIRQLFDRAALARIRERAVFVGRAWDYMIEHGYTSDVTQYVNGVFRAGHLPETHIDVTQTWSDLTTGTRFDEIATAVFGSTTRGYALRRSTLEGQQNPISLHQDASFIGTDPWYCFWTPLQDVGVDAPALQVCRRSGSPLVNGMTGRKGEMQRYVEATYRVASYWLPKLKAGDTLVFNSMMFHTTQTSPAMVKTRFSLELRGAITDRSVAIAGVPANWDDILVVDDVSDAPVRAADLKTRSAQGAYAP
jgi:ectoine hydroxylase-related dioxygenase (phytanoyl-CoA dioxygenase family)